MVMIPVAEPHSRNRHPGIRSEESRFRAMCEARDLPATRIGVVDQGSDAIEVQGLFTVSLEDLRSTSEGVLPGLFG